MSVLRGWFWSLLIVSPIVGFCNCSMFCCALLCVHSSFAIILIEERELVVWHSMSCWCLAVVVWLFLAVPRVCLHFVIAVFPDHIYYFYTLSGGHEGEVGIELGKGWPLGPLVRDVLLVFFFLSLPSFLLCQVMMNVDQKAQIFLYHPHRNNRFFFVHR